MLRQNVRSEAITIGTTLTNVLEDRGPFLVVDDMEEPVTSERSHWGFDTVTFATDDLDLDWPIRALWESRWDPIDIDRRQRGFFKGVHEIIAYSWGPSSWYEGSYTS